MKIQRTYHDVLYWASSPFSKDKAYHLTYLQSDILQKLIHYSVKNPNITYPNRVIAEHTFQSERQIKEILPKIASLGYIESESRNTSLTVKKRTIKINWQFIEKVKNDMPKKVTSDDFSEFEIEKSFKDIPIPQFYSETAKALPETLNNITIDGQPQVHINNSMSSLFLPVETPVLPVSQPSPTKELCPHLLTELLATFDDPKAIIYGINKYKELYKSVPSELGFMLKKYINEYSSASIQGAT